MPEPTAPRLLQLGPLPPGLRQLLEPRYQLLELWQAPDRAQYLAAHGGRFDGAVLMSRHGCAADIMQAVAGGVVACFGVGYDGIDLDAARTAGVQVSITPDVLTDCVADTALALMLATSRRLVDADRFVRRGDWMRGPYPLGRKVSGKRVGIVGLGRIGTAIARRAAAFDMPVAYHGRHAQPGVAYSFQPDLEALARWSDFLVLSCTGGPTTAGLVDAKVLSALGPDGCLINVARGSVVDEDALCAAVEAGTILGAGLDVYAHEPAVPEALLRSERVTLLPHMAASTVETRRAMEQLVSDNLAAFFDTGRVLTPPR